MGIPKLSRDLDRYRQTVLLRAVSEKHGVENAARLIIDGPAFVYFTFNRLLATRSAALDSLDAQPSYTEICTAVHSLLATIQSQGVEIDAIYFDGALPHGKREVRLARTERLRARLETFCKTCPVSSSRPTGSPAVTSQDGLSLLKSTTPFLMSSTLPEPPFMIPAVIEQLCGNPTFASIVHVVDGEADQYCASHARCSGSTILSNDSDLFVFDIGEQASVLSLDSLTIRADEDPRRMEIHGLSLRSKQVAAKLRLESLSRFAFERSRDPYTSFNNVVARAAIPLTPKHRSAFDEFMREYTVIDDFHPSNNEPAILDTRISELYYQLHNLGSPDSSHAPRVYLPVLIENHARTSSWTFGVELRTLAYSLLNRSSSQLSRRKPTVVDEYMRSGARIAPRPRTLYTQETEVIDALDRVLRDVRTVRSSLDSATYDRSIVEESRVWRLQGIFQVCKALIASQRSLPDRDWVAEFLSDGYVGDVLTLDAVHVEANVNAALYSLRVLKQCLAVIARRSGAEALSTTLMELHSEMQDMPGLCQLMASRLEMSITANPASRTASDFALSKLYEVLDADRS